MLLDPLRGGTPSTEDNVGTLLMMALLLVGLWVVVSLVFKVAGLLVHLLLLIGALLFVVWAWKKLTGRTSVGPTDTTP